jgi:integrase
MVRTPRKDGFYQVYIRVVHNRKPGYIKTCKMVSKNELDKKGDIKDPYVMQYCSARIMDYAERLLKHDTTAWTVKELVNFLVTGDSDVCFSDYARTYHDRMIDEGHERNARNYQWAYQHMERFAGTDRIMFSQITSAFINRWMKTLDGTTRAKQMYPICIRQIFKGALAEFNDYDAGIIRIKTNPFVKVAIPKADRPEKKAITPEECRTFFSAPAIDNGRSAPLSELGRDVAMMILCLAGINAMDLYLMKKADYFDGVLHYRRAKTMNSRSDGAYMEMRVPQILQSVFEKYLDRTGSEFLFNFHERMSTADSFTSNCSTGIKQICSSLGIPKEKQYSLYTFRHTWGTVAQNDCGATISEIGFAMNHSQRSTTVTRGYLKLDFSPAWVLNEKVIDFIFFSDKPSSTVRKTLANERDGLGGRMSVYAQISAKAYFRGKVVGELRGTGYANVSEIIAELAAKLPQDIPNRSIVLFKVANEDKGKYAVYEKQKGKGFV